MHRTVLEARQLPPAADLKRAFVAAILEHIDAGWRLGEFSSRSGTFFCDKNNEGRMVEISPTNPGEDAERWDSSAPAMRGLR
jgi:hypothetical protein